MKALFELIQTDDPAWSSIETLLADSSETVRVLPITNQQIAENALLQLQVTLRSTMGAIVYHTGGILVDHGWLRILGSGCTELNRSLGDWNQDKFPGNPPTALLFADDVIGGFFAINRGAFSGKQGVVHYFSPFELDWIDLGAGYTDFVSWAISGGLTAFYKDKRWSTWKDDIQSVDGNLAFSIYPYLFADGPPIEDRARRLISVEELYHVQRDMGRQIG